MKSKKNNIISLRVDDEQFDFIRTMADQFGISPADYLRLMIQVTLVKYREEVTLDANGQDPDHDII